MMCRIVNSAFLSFYDSGYRSSDYITVVITGPQEEGEQQTFVAIEPTVCYDLGSSEGGLTPA